MKCMGAMIAGYVPFRGAALKSDEKTLPWLVHRVCHYLAGGPRNVQRGRSQTQVLLCPEAP